MNILKFNEINKELNNLEAQSMYWRFMQSTLMILIMKRFQRFLINWKSISLS